MTISANPSHLVELLARGVSKRSIAIALGYCDTSSFRRALRAKGIRRTWTPCGVPVVEVRR